MPPPPEPKRDSTGGTIVILSGVTISLAFALAFAYLLFGPALVVVLLLAVGFSAFGVLHWVLWGRSMSGDTDEA